MKRILDSQGWAFDKDATELTLKTVWFLLYPPFGLTFCVDGVPLPLTDRLHASIWVFVIPQKNIYIYIFFCF